MKKMLLCLAAAVALLSSCSTVRTATSRSVNVSTSVCSSTTADLRVSDSKIEYVYTPTRKERKKLSQAKMIEKAVAQALKSNGNADVLVARQYEVDRKTGLLKRVRRITITGYAGTYTNFKN